MPSWWPHPITLRTLRPRYLKACEAGKHVYVEKAVLPQSARGGAGDRRGPAAQAAWCKIGTQRRSWPGIIEGIDKLHAGARIGRVLYSRGWYNNRRTSIGHGKAAAGARVARLHFVARPAPERPYPRQYPPVFLALVHWHWGTGELGNNGVHAAGTCAAGAWGSIIRSASPAAAASDRYNHDGQTPDTHTATFDFGNCSILWEGLSWSPAVSKAKDSAQPSTARRERWS